VKKYTPNVFETEDGAMYFLSQSFLLPNYFLRKNDRTGHFAFGVIVVMNGHRPDCARGPKHKQNT